MSDSNFTSRLKSSLSYNCRSNAQSPMEVKYLALRDSKINAKLNIRKNLLKRTSEENIKLYMRIRDIKTNRSVILGRSNSMRDTGQAFLKGNNSEEEQFRKIKIKRKSNKENLGQINQTIKRRSMEISRLLNNGPKVQSYTSLILTKRK